MNRYGPRVLIVEDEPSIALALAKSLRAGGWQTTCVATAAEALALLSAPPDLLILDLMLPGGSGAEVLLEVRARGLSVPVAVHTACARADVLAAVADLAPEKVYVKPIDWDDFLSFVAGLMAAFTARKGERPAR